MGRLCERGESQARSAPRHHALRRARESRRAGVARGRGTDVSAASSSRRRGRVRRGAASRGSRARRRRGREPAGRTRAGARARTRSARCARRTSRAGSAHTAASWRRPSAHGIVAIASRSGWPGSSSSGGPITIPRRTPRTVSCSGSANPCSPQERQVAVHGPTADRDQPDVALVGRQHRVPRIVAVWHEHREIGETPLHQPSHLHASRAGQGVTGFAVTVSTRSARSSAPRRSTSFQREATLSSPSTLRVLDGVQSEPRQTRNPARRLPAWEVGSGEGGGVDADETVTRTTVLVEERELVAQSRCDALGEVVDERSALGQALRGLAERCRRCRQDRLVDPLTGAEALLLDVGEHPARERPRPGGGP